MCKREFPATFLIYVAGLQPPHKNQRLWSSSAGLPHTGHRRTLLGAEANIQVYLDWDQEFTVLKSVTEQLVCKYF